MNMMWKVSALLGGVLALSGCSLLPFSSSHHDVDSTSAVKSESHTQAIQIAKAKKPDFMVSLANPASVFCIQSDGTSVIKTDSQGAQAGYCRLSDGRLVDEWQYYREHHKS